MSGTTAKLMAGLLTFSLGASLASLWFMGRLPLFDRESPPTNQEVNFKLTLEQQGPYGHYYDYQAPGGEKLMCGCVRFPSAERAGAELQHRTDFRPNLADIVEKGIKVDGEGHNVGERVVAVEEGVEKGRLAHVIWTRGEELCWIESPSLQHALALERQSPF